MSSTFNVDKIDQESDEACFLSRVMLTLDSGNVKDLPHDIKERLDCARHAAMLQMQGSVSEGSGLTNRRATAFVSRQEQIPESIRQRLDAIRAEALQRANVAQRKDEGMQTTRGGWWTKWAPRGYALPASAFASVCMLVTTLAVFNMAEVPETMPLAVAEDSLVLASDEEIELYVNLEFYQWLADNGL